MNERKKEIRKILLGYITYEDGYMMAADSQIRLRSLGLFNGSGSARVFGVTCRTGYYRIPQEEDSAEELCRKVFSEIGRKTYLETARDHPAVFLGPIFNNPDIIIGEEEVFEGETCLKISVYTARTPGAWLGCRMAFRKWLKKMPAGTEKIIKKKDKNTEKAEEGKGNDSRKTERQDTMRRKNNGGRKKDDDDDRTCSR